MFLNRWEKEQRSSQSLKLRWIAHIAEEMAHRCAIHRADVAAIAVIFAKMPARMAHMELLTSRTLGQSA
jgi:hypothetical protein